MTSLTSEFDSTTFSGEEMQRYSLYYFFSLTPDMNHHVTQNPPVPAVSQVDSQLQLDGYRYRYLMVRVHYFFASWLSVNCLSSPVNGCFEER